MIQEIPPQYATVKELPKRLQPRELFDRVGAEHVPDEVLLAILLKSGSPGYNVVDLARDLLRHFGSLTALTRATPAHLVNFRGVGPTKARELKAALELARRLSQEQVEEKPAIHSPEDAARLLREQARELDHERFWVLLLDTRNRLKEHPVMVSQGVLNASLVHAREVFRPAVMNQAAAIVVAHNHPSGDPSPSPEDLRVTRNLIEAGKLLNIRVLDHVIIGQSRPGQSTYFHSLRESGLVNFAPDG
ncbi:MAG: DNA repair protein RadC [Verrucomicrobia bacterium]|nr:DNA repair protein RadC [Verrucomicrobiota bacterium]MCH8513043.1 DNA repair protein RadC [Kiritimatiellia bacterium]